jgi:carbon monoxide dehydrogenase subunit G
VKFEGTASLPAPPGEVFSLLTDASRLARLLPGCERLEPDGPDRYKAAVKFGIAAISGKYAGTLEFAEKKPPHSLTLKMDGKGLPGFVKGEGRIELAAKGNDTELRYSGEAQVGGLIASVGQRMIDAAARKIVQQFFDAVKAELASAKSRAAAHKEGK